MAKVGMKIRVESLVDKDEKVIRDGLARFFNADGKNPVKLRVKYAYESKKTIKRNNSELKRINYNVEAEYDAAKVDISSRTISVINKMTHYMYGELAKEVIIDRYVIK